jgi:hypothetical protein
MGMEQTKDQDSGVPGRMGVTSWWNYCQKELPPTPPTDTTSGRCRITSAGWSAVWDPGTADHGGVYSASSGSRCLFLAAVDAPEAIAAPAFPVVRPAKTWPNKQRH